MADEISSSPQPPTLVTLNLICRMEWTDNLAYEYEFRGKDGIRQPILCLVHGVLPYFLFL